MTITVMTSSAAASDTWKSLNLFWEPVDDRRLQRDRACHYAGQNHRKLQRLLREGPNQALAFLTTSADIQCVCLHWIAVQFAFALPPEYARTNRLWNNIQVALCCLPSWSLHQTVIKKFPPRTSINCLFKRFNMSPWNEKQMRDRIHANDSSIYKHYW